jgi:hypothetical protein
VGVVQGSDEALGAVGVVLLLAADPT